MYIYNIYIIIYIYTYYIYIKNEYIIVQFSSVQVQLLSNVKSSLFASLARSYRSALYSFLPLLFIFSGAWFGCEVA